MRKILINIILILVAFVLYYLQLDFFDWFTIAGIKPNLFIIFVLFIGLFGNGSMGTIYGAIIGLFLDFIFQEKVGINVLGLSLIGFLAIGFDKNFSKDSRMTIMLMVLGATIIFEVLSYFLNYVLYATNLDLLIFIKLLLIETIYNVIITIIIYPILQKFGYYMENEYAGNRILTRYF